LDRAAYFNCFKNERGSIHSFPLAEILAKVIFKMLPDKKNLRKAAKMDLHSLIAEILAKVPLKRLPARRNLRKAAGMDDIPSL
jgi:hypothetical protein